MFSELYDIKDIKEIHLHGKLYFGVGAIARMDTIASELRRRGVESVLCLTGGSSYRISGAWEPVCTALSQHGIRMAHFDGVTPNPDTDMLDRAAALGRQVAAQAVIGIGGGSAIDSAKSVAILLAYPETSAEALFGMAFRPDTSLPVIAVNLTHGTGTEVNRFAVATMLSRQVKRGIGYDVSYPLFAIDDPQLMEALPPTQIRYVSIDALNHALEAATASGRNALAILLARESIRIIGKQLPLALKDVHNLEHRSWLAWGAMLAGIAFDNTRLHYTHALEHPVSAMRPAVPHGLGLAALAPAVVEACWEGCPDLWRELLAPLVPGLKGGAGEARMAATGLKHWFAQMGVTVTLSDLFAGDEVPLERLVELAQINGPIANGPVSSSPELIRQIYEHSL